VFGTAGAASAGCPVGSRAREGVQTVCVVTPGNGSVPMVVGWYAAARKWRVNIMRAAEWCAARRSAGSGCA